jgi:hypothetical protein
MSTISLYYNHCVFEPLWLNWHWKINTNALTTFLLFEFCIVCTSFQPKNHQNKQNSFLMISPIRLHYNHCVLEPLPHE